MGCLGPDPSRVASVYGAGSVCATGMEQGAVAILLGLSAKVQHCTPKPVFPSGGKPVSELGSTVGD